MTELMGHLGMALLWASPAWFLWERRVALSFAGLALTTAMLPDVDLVLRRFLSVSHHGITHTVVFVTAVALIAGAVVVAAFKAQLRSIWGRRRGRGFSDRSLFAFVVGGFLVGGLSHVFTDMLSAPDIAEPVEPFWPLVDKPWSLDLIWYGSLWWNAVLLALGIGVQAGLAYLDFRDRRPDRSLRGI